MSFKVITQREFKTFEVKEMLRYIKSLEKYITNIESKGRKTEKLVKLGNKMYKIYSHKKSCEYLDSLISKMAKEKERFVS